MSIETLSTLGASESVMQRFGGGLAGAKVTLELKTRRQDGIHYINHRPTSPLRHSHARPRGVTNFIGYHPVYNTPQHDMHRAKASHSLTLGPGSTRILTGRMG
jgi:hypothetical protein